jgi:crotonobetainyl-CoA:carnitine CoA-transferase CaiB-like acyl-CoA transferase
MGEQTLLTGYKVLDFTHALAGPTTTRLMAEMGAEVIKVEQAPYPKECGPMENDLTDHVATLTAAGVTIREMTSERTVEQRVG